MNQISNSQKTPHISPLQASYGGVSCEDFGEKWSCYNGTALYVMFPLEQPHSMCYETDSVQNIVIIITIYLTPICT